MSNPSKHEQTCMMPTPRVYMTVVLYEKPEVKLFDTGHMGAGLAD